ncbi:bacillithiol system redox-active protein YtxJ [Paenibacillus sp. UMB4589-SE434]|uniref:bacillithiol system redox-active protein YtxJ n=1 Tax=Paenibacillus sp. UMB4589-SE434 TaxID=3046314 RepID=UPI00254F12A6|nr:bacillithiol system redox-active protein YtxJ [Paenibacillus sp. UMB4589-SE434]MDK8180874.1 bacillithiol system redox-active protein YtxJ [Paenibacillus sp. UMB4589-SE434]
MYNVDTDSKLHELISKSHEQPVVLFKHSTRCPISTNADEEMSLVVKDFSQGPIQFGLIYVVENRDVSLLAADELGIKHESPQVLVLQDGKVLWHDSHYGIRYDKLEPILSQFS